ncbi:MAG TPA: heme-binding protein [Candidatus Eisenbacteria bacterium]|nr:heme-binding protein [Candidatus Eisenbacteria bacterium]
MAIPGEKAIQMVRAAHKQAAELDIAVTAVVVDQAGRMIALGRMDKARPITVEIALNRAYTAASFQQPTKELAGVAGQPWFQSLVVSSNGRIMPGGGALPIVEGGSVVGAIAVAGGTEEQDQRCAEIAFASYA